METTSEPVSRFGIAVLLLITGCVWLSDFCREPLIDLVDSRTGEFRREYIEKNGEPPKLLFSYFGYSGFLLMEEVLEIPVEDSPLFGSTPYSDGTMGLTWKGFCLRFLITEVSPTSYGSLADVQTWKYWWVCNSTIAGISKSLLLASFYSTLTAMLFWWSGEGWDFFGNLSLILLLLSIAYISWILLVPQLIRPALSAVFGFLSSVLPHPLSWLLQPSIAYEWILYQIGVTCLGTLIIFVTFPILLLHGFLV